MVSNVFSGDESFSESGSLNSKNLDRDGKISILYTNVDSLMNKRDELEVEINIKQPDVIIVTEVYPKNLDS